MRVTCKINSGKGLPSKHFAVFRGETEKTVFNVSTGKEYPVFGMALWQGAIILLLVDDTDKPNWYSLELFAVSDPRLPSDWLFSNTVAVEHDVEAIWGYERLATDPQHYEGLIERHRNAVEAFEKERQKAGLKVFGEK